MEFRTDVADLGESMRVIYLPGWKMPLSVVKTQKKERKEQEMITLRDF